MQSLLEVPPHKWHPLLVQFLIFSVLQNLLATTMLPLRWYDTRFFNRMENMPQALPGHCTPSPKPRMLLIPWMRSYPRMLLIPPDPAHTPGSCSYLRMLLIPQGSLSSLRSSPWEQAEKEIHVLFFISCFPVPAKKNLFSQYKFPQYK